MTSVSLSPSSARELRHPNARPTLGPTEVNSQGNLIDTHCHLDDPKLAAHLPAVLHRAKQSGVIGMVTIGCAKSLGNLDSAIDVARRHPDQVRATTGIHPHDAEHQSDALFEALEELARDPLIVAVGETGLDFFYEYASREAQLESLRRNIAIAKRVDKPLIIHTRDAASETLEVLKEEHARDVGGIIHCFSEDAHFAKASLDLGFVASFSGIVTFKNASEVREAARKQPEDAILVETDAPYLAPVPKRGSINEPSFVGYTAAMIAELRGQTTEELHAITTQNARRVLNLSFESL